MITNSVIRLTVYKMQIDINNTFFYKFWKYVNSCKKCIESRSCLLFITGAYGRFYKLTFRRCMHKNVTYLSANHLKHIYLLSKTLSYASFLFAFYCEHIKLVNFRHYTSQMQYIPASLYQRLSQKSFYWTSIILDPRQFWSWRRQINHDRIRSGPNKLI